MEIGDKLTLYAIKNKQNIWKDPWGRSHDGYLVIDIREITITDKRTDVPGMWRASDKYTGYLAADEQGNKFSLGWNSWPDDSIWGASWQGPKIDKEYVDWMTFSMLRYYTPLVKDGKPYLLYKEED